MSLSQLSQRLKKWGCEPYFVDKAYVAISRYEDLGNTWMGFLKEINKNRKENLLKLNRDKKSGFEKLKTHDQRKEGSR